MTNKFTKIITYLLFVVFFFNQKVYAYPNENKTLDVVGDNNYPPYEFIDESGNYRGFNLDIIRALAIELGLEVRLIPSNWDDAILMLKNGNVDIIQGMNVTNERKRFFDFTEPILTNSRNIFVLSSCSNISELSDLKGKKVAIQSDDVSLEFVYEISNVCIVEKLNQQEAFRSLVQGDVDAYIGNKLTGTYFVQNYELNESIKIVGYPIVSTEYSIAVKKGNEELLKLLNSGISAIKSNGIYDKIYQKWFGQNISRINERIRKLLNASLIALCASFIILSFISLWNKRLKEEVEHRTQEMLKLNEIAMHNNKMQEIGILSAGIAHELRNPLTSINAFIDLIPSKIDDENFRKELIKIVPSEIKRLNDLVSSLLDYSKPKNPKPEIIQLSEILSEVLTLIKQKLQQKNIQVITTDINICLYADKTQMKQILINILLNCIDAVDNNGQIVIESKVTDRIVSIIIKDNGIGVPTEMLSKIFDPFCSSKKTGYGIGLAVTYRLIKENRGEIKLESEDGKGTTVTIYMPIEPPDRKE